MQLYWKWPWSMMTMQGLSRDAARAQVVSVAGLLEGVRGYRERTASRAAGKKTAGVGVGQGWAGRLRGAGRERREGG